MSDDSDEMTSVQCHPIIDGLDEVFCSFCERTRVRQRASMPGTETHEMDAKSMSLEPIWNR